MNWAATYSFTLTEVEFGDNLGKVMPFQ
jgi:hypothetical protein